jgi:phosphoserine phosphatase
LFKAYELGIRLNLFPLPLWLWNLGKTQHKQRYIINILGETLTAVQLSAVTKIMSDQNLNIDAIKD